MSASIELQTALAHIEALARTRRLSEVRTEQSEAGPALQVAGENFAHLADAKTLVLRCPPEQKVLLLQTSPEIYFDSDGYVGKAMVLVHLDRIGDEELALRLEDAWQYKASSH